VLVLKDAAANATAASKDALAKPEGAAPQAGIDLLSSQASAGQLLAYSAAPYASYSWLTAFQRLEQTRLDLALCLHHDAITGTSRQQVVDDYIHRMAAGATAAAGVLSDLASLVLGGLPRALEAAAVSGSSRLEPLLVVGDAAIPSDAATLEPAPLTHVPHVLPVEESLHIRLADDGTV
jgi:hypothetical protein